jgi:hypothetical protein
MLATAAVSAAVSAVWPSACLHAHGVCGRRRSVCADADVVERVSRLPRIKKVRTDFLQSLDSAASLAALLYYRNAKDAGDLIGALRAGIPARGM